MSDHHELRDRRHELPEDREDPSLEPVSVLSGAVVADVDRRPSRSLVPVPVRRRCREELSGGR